MRNIYRAGLLLTVMLAIAACGTVATPRYEADRIIDEAQVEATHIIETALAESGEVDAEAVAVEPTEVPAEEETEELEPTEEPTATVEPTEVSTEAPTATVEPTEVEAEPTEMVMEEETEEVAEEATDDEHADDGHGDDEHDAAEETSEDSELEAEIAAAVDAADAAAGEITFLSTGCVACHMTTDMTMIGPGLQGVFERAGDHADHRPADQGPYEYVFTSIRNSQAFIVEGFTPNLMPVYSEAQLSDDDIYNIMAYLRQFSDMPE